MAVWQFIIFGLIAIIILALVIVLVYLFFRQSEDESRKNIFLNFMSHKSKGRFLGREKSVNTNGNDRRIEVIYTPKDVVIDDKTKTIEDVKVILGNSKRVVIPKGILSADCDIVFGLAARPEDYPAELKNTPIGIALASLTSLYDLAETEKKVLREGIDRRDELSKKIGTGELSKEYIEMHEEMVKDFLKSVVNSKDSKDKAPINMTGGFPQHQQ